MAQSKGNSLADLIQKETKEFALLASFFLNHGRLITFEPLYRFLEDEFDITVSENLPRVENGLLSFVLV
jgi:hypothetical protein